MPTFTKPNIYYGAVTDSDSAVIANIAVVCHNRTTDSRISVSTDSAGKYVLDLANAGYSAGDSITIYVRTKGYTGETSFTQSGEGGLIKNITAYAGVTSSTLRTNLWDGMYWTLKDGIYEVSTNNIHSAMNDTLISNEGYPQVIIYPPDIDTEHAVIDRKRVKKEIMFTIDIFHTSSASMKVLADEVEHNIWDAQEVWRGLYLTDLSTNTQDYDWYQEGNKKIHTVTLEISFKYRGSL